MAMIAACVMEPGEYFAINMKGDADRCRREDDGAGFPVTADDMQPWRRSGEKTMFDGAGGAPTFAVGMAHMFARVFAEPDPARALVSLRDHVRGPVHPDHDRCRNSGRAIPFAGCLGQFMGAPAW